MWSAIAKSNTTSPNDSAEAHMHKYKNHIYHANEFHVDDINVDDFIALCHKDIESAPGLDGCAAKDLDSLSHYSYQLLVNMLNTIEKGAD